MRRSARNAAVEGAVLMVAPAARADRAAETRECCRRPASTVPPRPRQPPPCAPPPSPPYPRRCRSARRAIPRLRRRRPPWACSSSPADAALLRRLGFGRRRQCRPALLPKLTNLVTDASIQRVKGEPEVDILFLNVLLDPQEHFVRPLSRPFVVGGRHRANRTRGSRD